GGKRGPKEFVLREQESKQGAGGQRASGLAEDVGSYRAPRKAAGGPKADGHGGVQVCPGDIADGVNHGEDNQAESEGDAGVSDGAAAGFVDNDGACSCEDQGERSERF